MLFFTSRGLSDTRGLLKEKKKTSENKDRNDTKQFKENIKLMKESFHLSLSLATCDVFQVT